jgi:putative ABC transport system ATP-binding protein
VEQLELVRSKDGRAAQGAAGAVEIRNVSKVFTDPQPKYVFTNLNLTVNHGEFVALVGPVGSGKTTLLGLIAGLLRPTSGHIYVHGVDTTALPERSVSEIRSGTISLVPQVQTLFDELTVYENIELPLIFQRLGGAERRLRVEQNLERMGISSDAHRKVTGLSVGERQIVAISRALSQDLPILLMDEPTESLDPLISELVLEALRGDNLTKGKTIVAATHDKKIMELAARTIRMRKVLL